jgi:uncharacterized Zn-binding protein involved in type VI secretion
MIPFGIMTATTDHGGTVMATQQQAIANGMAFLRAGDGFVCPKCKVWSTLIMSNQNIIMFGKPVAFAGDKFTCGATLMPNQSLVGGDKQGGGSASSSKNRSAIDKNNAIANPSHMANHNFDRKFRLLDQDTHEPRANVSYELIHGSKTIQGKTDNDGFTEVISDETASKV